VSILRFEAVRREVGTFVILDDVTAAVAHGDRVGLVGPNGSGKTTLLRLANGQDEPDLGHVGRKRGLTIGFLAQETNLDASFTSQPSLRVAVRSGAVEVERMERELAQLEASGAAGVSSARYADLRHRFETLDGYHLDLRVEEALAGLAFARDVWDRPPLHLSGGEQTRAALARLLVADPDLLLLDEPTNHLDLGALEWLEQALGRRSGALIVASHDRAFLDAVVTRTWELRDRRLQAFRGGFSAYAVQSAERDARQRKDAESSRETATREAELVQRYRSHRNYSKMHEHERRLASITAVDAPRASRRMKLTPQALVGGGPVRSGDVVVSIRDAVLGLGLTETRPDGIPVVRAVRLEARRGDRIGIVGPNGVGKTTLLRTVAGEIYPLEGTARIGASVQLAYLAQLRDAAFPGATVLDTLLETVNVPLGEARGYLARFLFRGEDVFKPVSELSGGERSRLELALLGVTPANLLLLDEPTNHLDIPAREALEAFLRESGATLLIVSHDRRLLQQTCTSLWVVEPTGANGVDQPDGGDSPTGTAPSGRHVPAVAAAFAGGYAEWRAAVADGWTIAGAIEAARGAAGVTAPVRRVAADGFPTGGAGPRRAAGKDGGAPGGRPANGRARGTPGSPALPRLSKDAYRRQKAAVEADLTRLGLRRTQLELALGTPAILSSFVELGRVTSELADVTVALAAAEDAWLSLEERAPAGRGGP